PHNYAIVDEVDSVLIDDARTPLIISGPTPKGDQQAFDQYKPIVQKLYEAQRTYVAQILTQAKKMLAENPDPKPQDESAMLLLRAHRGLPKNKALIKFLSEPGMKQVLQRTESFFMQDQNRNMHLIDDELYFVIEEKLNTVDIMDKGIDLISKDADEAKMFIMPDVGAQIAELEKENLSSDEKLARKEEIYNNYAVASDRIHTVHQLLKAYTMFDKDVEYVIIDNKVKIVDEQTGRIMEGRRYSDGLHQAIEAKENVKVEAATQTYATITLQNYFRMYKKLAGMTGTAETEAGEFWNIYKLDVVVIPTNKPVIRVDANDLVYKTKREKYAAVVDEILRLHEAGRPVLVGTTSVEISELLSNILTRRHIEHNVLNAKLHKKEADIVAEAGREGTVTIATNMAGRGTDIKLTPEVREKGGLAIIGTERHDSRRVDRQLRGRAGRQGDPGSSQFFVSLEDDLMRLFGSDRIAKVMDSMGHQDGDVIQHSMISKSIERAQKKVEENNFGIRKRLLEYDDVMNKQRSTIYRKRRNALFGDRLAIDIAQMVHDVCETLVADAWEAKDFEYFKMSMIRTFGCESPFEEQYFLQERQSTLVEKLYPVVYDHYKAKLQKIAEQAYPVIERVYLEHGDRFQNIAIPFTDGKKTINIVAPLKKCYETQGREVGLSFEKGITLAVIDNAWKEHLRAMDDLKESVQNASYEQKDPLLIYKLESFNLFDQLLVRISEEIVTFLNIGKLPIVEETELKEAKLPESDAKKLQTGRQEMRGRQVAPGKPANEPIRAEKKVGRNDPCPCGSGKKYKNCHGRFDSAE
ncbi:MAG: SEC-C domain-containing protein, partial [Bacteroidales bacterium]|nr:SEC-C domain-containing protein [Bacteroidales bacterium]